MRCKFNRYLLTASLASLAAGLPSIVHAQETEAASSNEEFSIPSQPLEAALRSFSEQADADVLYPPELASGKKSTAVRGTMPPAAALHKLLIGTGITMTQVSAKSFALKSSNGTVQNDSATMSAVSGIVIDYQSGSALPGAKISVVGNGASAVTDNRGFFNIPDVPISASQILVEYIGQPAETIPLPEGALSRRKLVLELGQAASKEIVVSAFLSSTQKALNQQMNAPNNSTIVSSDLLGSFPAENITEALRRVPGFAFGRDDATGEGTRVSVRGFSSEAINIQLNGVDLQGTGFERTIDLSDFLTDNISQIFAA